MLVGNLLSTYTLAAVAGSSRPASAVGYFYGAVCSLWRDGFGGGVSRIQLAGQARLAWHHGSYLKTIRAEQPKSVVMYFVV
jgi:hypothetical protein